MVASKEYKERHRERDLDLQKKAYQRTKLERKERESRRRIDISNKIRLNIQQATDDINSLFYKLSVKPIRKSKKHSK